MNKPSPTPRWWQDAASLQRVVADLLAAELGQMRPGRARPAAPWSARLDLRADAGADSLELLGLASAMEQMLGLGRGTDTPLLAHTRLGDWLAAAEAGLERGGATLSFRTSGSTGTPKAVPHALALLWQEAEYLASLFPGRRRIVGVVPAHHIYGFLFTILLPRALGIGPEQVLDLRAHAAGELGQQLDAGDLVIGYPDFWRAFGAAARAPAGVTGVSSTAPCPGDVARGALAAGLERLVEVYGSSETAGVGWRDDPEAPFSLFPYWSHEGAGLVRQAPDGSARSYPLQDRLAWSTPASFVPVGRIDSAVQVGGVNVFPAYVADVLRMHPAVLEASVRLMRPDEGHRLKAFIVARDESAEPAQLRAQLDAWMGERLAAAECPAAYSFGPTLPRQASGKPADWIIDAWP